MELACLAQLERSHRRHDEVMADLLAATRRLAAGRPEREDVRAVHNAVAFFGKSVTRHFLDEEGSVFPRLSTRRPELAEALAALSAEHPGQIALHGEIAEAAKQLDGGEARPTVGKQLLELAERLAKQHEAHVTREDELFRGAHEALTAEDDREITAEMEMRRDRDGDQGGRGGRGGGGGGGRGGGGGGGRGGGGGGGRGRVKVVAKAKAPAKTAAKKTAAKKPAAKKPAAKPAPGKKTSAKRR